MIYDFSPNPTNITCVDQTKANRHTTHTCKADICRYIQVQGEDSKATVNVKEDRKSEGRVKEKFEKEVEEQYLHIDF